MQPLQPVTLIIGNAYPLVNQCQAFTQKALSVMIPALWEAMMSSLALVAMA